MTTPLSDDKILPIEDVRHAMKQFAMYQYHALVDVGFSPKDAKQRVADTLVEVYNQYCDEGNVPKQVLGTVEKKLDDTMGKLKVLAKTNPSLRSVYDNLVSIQAQLKKR